MGDSPLRDFVTDGLRKRWSPAQVCHSLVKEHPDDQGMRVVEAIYQPLYVQVRGGLSREVATALRTGRTCRKPHKSPTSVAPGSPTRWS